MHIIIFCIDCCLFGFVVPTVLGTSSTQAPTIRCKSLPVDKTQDKMTGQLTGFPSADHQNFNVEVSLGCIGCQILIGTAFLYWSLCGANAFFA
jgi:hypothetical protein